MPIGSSPRLRDLQALLAAGPLTMDEAISIALATNPALAQASEQLYIYEGRTSEARAALNPTLTGNGGEVYLKHDLEPSATAVATLPIDIMGLLRAAVSQAQFQEVAARLDVNRVRNQLIYDVKNAFYNVLRAEALVTVATEDLQNSLDQLHDATVKYQARAVAYFDVVRAQTLVDNAQQNVIGARNAVSINTATLSNLLGINTTSTLRISDQGAVQEPPSVPSPSSAPVIPPTELPAPESNGNGPAPGLDDGSFAPTQTAPSSGAVTLTPGSLTAASARAVVDEALKPTPEIEPLIQEALQTRPEVLEGAAEIAAAGRGYRLAQRSLLPGIQFSVGYFYIRNSTGTKRIDEPEGELMLSLPILDGGLLRARVREAKGAIASAITFKRQQMDTVTLDVEQAYLNLVQARDQVAVANQALVQARAAFDLAVTRYNAGVSEKAGVSPILEVSDAQAGLTGAEDNQVNALYNYNASRAALDRAIGRYSYIPEGPGYPNVPSPGVLGSGSVTRIMGTPASGGGVQPGAAGGVQKGLAK